MKVEIDTESDKFRKIIEESVVNSEKIQEQIDNILETYEVQVILTEKVKKILMSDGSDDKIKKKIKDYIEELDIDYDEKVTDIITKNVRKIIMSKFE